MERSPTMARQARIVATIGPASRSEEKLLALIRAGANVLRLNGSHSDPETIREDVARIRAVARRSGRAVAVLLDLQGPKIRTGPAAVPLTLHAGQELRLVMDPLWEAGEGRVGCTWPALAEDLAPGDRILFADGAMAAHVRAVDRTARPAEVIVVMEDGGTLGAFKGINVPGAGLSAPSLTDKDLRDLEAGIAAGVDYVALSFVRSARDVEALRGHLRRLGAAHTPICAKIEKPQALDDLPAILAHVEAIMVARGDLGVESSFEEVPIIQKTLIREANRAGVLVVTATQMLESMVTAPRPTRAEATDVVNAILDGTDAVMLSAETAIGADPVRAVETMDALVRVAESSPFMMPPPLSELPSIPGTGATVVRAACYAVREEPRPLVVFTWSGYSAIVASKARPAHGVYAFTPNEATADKLSLAWGVTPFAVALLDSSSEMIAIAERELLDRGLVAEGAEVVMLAGQTHTRGATNMMTVEVLQRGGSASPPPDVPHDIDSRKP